MSYQDFYNAYVKRYVYKTKKSCQDDVIKLWNTAKQKFPKKEELIHHIQHEIERFLREAAERKVRSTLAFLQKTNTKISNSSSIQAGTSIESVPNVECAGRVKINDHNIQQAESAVQHEINDQQSGDQNLDVGPQPAGASKRKNHPLVISDNEDEAMSNTTPSNNSDAAKSLTPRAGPGRPRLEEEQSELLKTISDLALFGASAEERRRYGQIRAKRHVVTVPVKLSRPEADHHKAHQDQYFSVASIRSLETIASVLGPNSVTFLSQDDKARVPIGLTAANKQAPLLMHVEYKVSLPDHDFVIASRHKLIPSMYALCEVKPNEMGRPEAVSYSGPTYIAIRSGKHSSSTATSHAQDLDTLLTIESFSKFIKNIDSKVKPVLIISSDGGPDENPRYRKVIAHAIDHFKQYDLDAVFIVTNALAERLQ
ncbi:hypothetical protein EVAR_80696_1 [Eumeta japonica]|uniref:Uncharacterized protein n=1 Tax=Eumeta variegata TaxID=151549 RepID=A0A4C1U437_EUMVA|nr:hypothetical protein EVAR_80696_1 [Eumeta japonica]